VVQSTMGLTWKGGGDKAKIAVDLPNQGIKAISHWVSSPCSALSNQSRRESSHRSQLLPRVKSMSVIAHRDC